MASQLKDRIRAIAAQLAEDNQMSRSELAYQLKEYGIGQDTQEISRLVYEIYEEADVLERKQLEYFISNDMQDTLVSAYKRYAMADNLNLEYLQELSSKSLSESTELLDQFSSILSEVVVNGSSDSILTRVGRWITGTSGIAKVQSEAVQIYEHYERVIESYEEATLGVEQSVADFLTMRDVLQEYYMRYTEALVDMFGDQLIAQDPDLFDFSQIEYLDVQHMFELISLEFNRLQGKCTELMGVVAASFNKNMKTAVTVYKHVNDKRAAAVVAVFGLLNHHLDAAEKTARLKRELSLLKTAAKKDIAHILADGERLSLIHYTLEHLLIPKIDLFGRFSKHILSDELQAILDKLYAEPRIAELQQRRKDCRIAITRAYRQIEDSRDSIEFYQGELTYWNDVRDSLREEYEKIMFKCPRIPSPLKMTLTFGKAQKEYEKDFASWMSSNREFLGQHGDILAEIQINEEELSSQSELIKRSEQEIESLTAEYARLSKELRQIISVDDKLKEALYPHFNDLIALLRGAKELLSQGLDEEQLKAIPESVYPEQSLVQMSDEQLLLNYTKQYVSGRSISVGDVQKVINRSSNLFGTSSAESFEEEDLLMVAQQADETVQRAVALYEELLALENQLAEDRAKEDFYLSELQRIQNSYKTLSGGVEQEAELLRQVMEQVKFSASDEERKAALCLLAGIDKNAVSIRDWEAFMSGQKTIVI